MSLQHISVEFVIISTDVQDYSSTSVSGAGGGGFSHNGTGLSHSKSIASNTGHYVINKVWAVCLDNNAEFKIELPAGFDVREGHTIITFGYYSLGSENSLVVER